MNAEMALEAGLPGQGMPASRPARWPRAAARALLYVAVPVLLLALWQALVQWRLVHPLLLPPPAKVMHSFLLLAASGELAVHVGDSLRRLLAGFGLAAATGVTLGVGIGLCPLLARASDLAVGGLRPVPPVVWMPLALLWFGIDGSAEIAVVFLGAVFPILVNTIRGVRQLDPRHAELIRVLELPRRHAIAVVVLPGALPLILRGLRAGMVAAWLCVAAVELVVATSGIGYLIMDARHLAHTETVLVGIICFGVMGKLLETALRLAEAELVPWRAGFPGGEP